MSALVVLFPLTAGHLVGTSVVTGMVLYRLFQSSLRGHGQHRLAYRSAIRLRLDPGYSFCHPATDVFLAWSPKALSPRPGWPWPSTLSPSYSLGWMKKTVALYFTWHQKWRNGLRKSEPSAFTSLSAFRSLHKSKIHRMGCLDCHREFYGPVRKASRPPAKELFRVVMDWTCFLQLRR